MMYCILNVVVVPFAVLDDFWLAYVVALDFFWLEKPIVFVDPSDERG